MNYFSGLGNVDKVLLTSPKADGFNVNWQSMGMLLKYTGTKVASYIYPQMGARTIKASYFFKARAECNEFINFYKDRKGEHKKFWIPNWLNEFLLLDTIQQQSAVAIIRDVGLKLRSDGNVRVFLKLKNGDWLIRRITTVNTLIENREQLVFDSAVPYAIAPSDVEFFGRVLLVRFEGNLQLKITKADDSELYAETSVTMVELPYEYAEV